MFAVHHCAKLVHFSTENTILSSEAALNDLQWKTLKQRRLVMKARLMFRIIHGQAPAVLIESFRNPNAPQHDYYLRNSDYGFYLTKPKTEYMRKSISLVVQNFGIIYHRKLEIQYR